MNAHLQILTATLKAILPDAKLKATQLECAASIHLWLIDPEGMHCPLSEQQTNAVWENPPYWSFCWSSGLAFAQKILADPTMVQGKTVLDFGCGSGVVGIAAVKAGAKRVILCDIDPVAKIACIENMALNNVTADYLDDFAALQEPVDVLLAADVLYDPDNFQFLDKFLLVADKIVLADSRVKNFSRDGYEKISSGYAVTAPDLGENEDVKVVRFYQASKLEYKHVE